MNRTISPTVRGLAWIVLAGITFTAFTGVIRYVGSELHPAQSAFIRYAWGFVIMGPFIARHGLALFRTRRPGAHAVRGFAHAFGVILWFYAIAHLPLAEVMALGFTSPIFVAVGAALFLGEAMSGARVVAILVGFAGALVILRPGIAVIDPAAFAMLAAAPLFALSKLLAKSTVAYDSAPTVVMQLTIFATLGMLVPALLVWRTPGFEEVMWIGLSAVFATASHLCIVKGLQDIDVTVAQPAEFLQLVWAALLGLAFFGEHPDLFIVTGGAVIVASATWLTRIEVGRGARH